MSKTIKSDYYEGRVSFHNIVNIFPSYIKWCKENNAIPEITMEELETYGDELPTNILDHILYHSEINGLDISEILIE